MMPNFYMLIGVPGSGKSTWLSREFLKLNEDQGVFYVLSTDDYIEDYAKSQGKTYNEVFKEAIGPAEAALQSDLEEAITHGFDIVWDQTNVSRKSRAKKLAKIPSNYNKYALVFPVPDTEVLSVRLANRPGKTIPQHVVESMIATFEFPKASEGFDKIYMYVDNVGLAQQVDVSIA